jgi:hypothetical protein
LPKKFVEITMAKFPLEYRTGDRVKGIAGKVRVQGTGDIGQETTDTDIDTVR